MLESVCVPFRCLNLQSRTLLKNNIVKHLNTPLNAGSFSFIPTRTTIIVKRPFPPTLYKEGNNVRLRTRTHYYNFVEDTNNRPEPLIDVVLSSYVQGVGNPGDMISMKMSAAYNKLLVPGLADYATTEMTEYSKRIKADIELQGKQVPVSVERCIKSLQGARISLLMNQSTDWTVEPWHIRANARKRGIHILSDDCIELPRKPIKGPDMALEGKEFLVTITINKKFKVKTRFVIHHWTANPAERLPLAPDWWRAPADWLFPEDEETFKANLSPTSQA